MADLIPWAKFEEEYSSSFSAEMGAPAKSWRMALGALIIKEKLGISDRETVEQIKENPYLQNFIGMSSYSNEAPFDASMLVHFRERISAELINKVNQEMVKKMCKETSSQSTQKKTAEPEKERSEPLNRGKLILDATCAPADISYPTDLELLNQARKQTEKIIDLLYEQVKIKLDKKPYENKKQSIDDRIVSLSQPHIRPIVRGKAGKSVEFGAKLSASYCNGYVFLDHISWDNFNESGDLKAQVEAFKNYTGFYPESVHVDKIYRTKENRAWCKERGIRISGVPLGRPPKTVSKEKKKQALQDERIRNSIEGKFGQGKRRFSLGRVMAKLSHTSQTAIAITFLVMNLSTHLSRVFYAFLYLFSQNRPFLEIGIIESYDFTSYRQTKLIFNLA